MTIKYHWNLCALSVSVLVFSGCGQGDLEALEGGGEDVLGIDQSRAGGYTITVGESPADLALPDGHTIEDFVEVAPGVHLLRDLTESGQVTFIPDGPADGGRPTSNSDAPTLPVAPPAECQHYGYYGNCYDYRSANGSGSVYLGGSAFSWSDKVSAWSQSSYNDCSGEYFQSTGASYSICSSSSPSNGMGIDAYIYVNGNYVGYVSASAPGSTSICKSGSLSASCSGGVVTAELRPVNHFFPNLSATGMNLMAVASCNKCSSGTTCCDGGPIP